MKSCQTGIIGMEAADDFAFGVFRDEEERLVPLLVLLLAFLALTLGPFALGPEPDGFRRGRLFVVGFRDLRPPCSETVSWYSSDSAGFLVK